MAAVDKQEILSALVGCCWLAWAPAIVENADKSNSSVPSLLFHLSIIQSLVEMLPGFPLCDSNSEGNPLSCLLRASFSPANSLLKN